MLPWAAAARSLPCSLDAGSAGFYAGAARVLPGAAGQRWLLRWHGACAAWGGGCKAAAWLPPCSPDAGFAGFYAGLK